MADADNTTKQAFECNPVLARWILHLANTPIGMSTAEWSEFVAEINAVCRQYVEVRSAILRCADVARADNHDPDTWSDYARGRIDAASEIEALIEPKGQAN